MVCQLPNRLGRPRHLHPCSATYKMAFRTCRCVERHVAALGRQARLDVAILGVGDFHVRSIKLPSSVNTL